jgi:3-(3-hydroxy-phenyl)propionate hydroxylase
LHADQYDVVIVGLGPVGGIAANLCGQAGLRTLVVERGVEPYLLPRAVHMDAEAMRILHSVGLAKTVASLTRPLGGSVYLGCDGRQIRVFRSQDTRAALGWPASNLFYQPELEGILRQGLQRFPNVEVRLAAEFAELEQDAEGARLRITSANGADGGWVGAHFVLACDGASSPVRKALNLDLEDMGFEERWLVIDGQMSGAMRWPERYDIPAEVRDGRYSLMICDPARPATIIPGAGRHRRWEYMLLPAESDEHALQPGNIGALLADWTDPADVEVVRAAVYRFHGLVATQWRSGAVFLMGDTAHQTPPFFGQGMCHGFRDAAQLVWKLALVRRGLAGPDLLDTYQAEREPHVRAIISAALTAGAAVCILDPEAAELRDARFRAEEAARAGAAVAMTDVVPPIRAGLVEPDTGGDRIPQPSVVGEAGAAPLDDLLAGRLTLLLVAESLDPHAIAQALPSRWRDLGGQVLHLLPEGRPAQRGAIVDASGSLGAWLAKAGAAWALIRPDRYVFAKGRTAEALAASLQHLLLSLGPVPGRLAAEGTSAQPEESQTS